MSTLKVKFTGLCLLVSPTEENGPMRVLLPDARNRRKGTRRLIDGTLAAPHVGFLRWKLKNMDGSTFAGDEEGFFRLDRTRIEIESESGGPVDRTGLGNVLDFHRIAPELGVPAASLQGNNAAKDLLALMDLRGGKFSDAVSGGNVSVSCQFAADPQVFNSASRQVTWEIEVDETVHIRLEPMQGSPLDPTTITLVGDEIEIDVSNVCPGDGMVDWDAIEPWGPPDPESDIDFGWYYQLLAPRTSPGKSIEQMLKGHRLRIPYPKPGSSVGEYFTNCFLAYASPFEEGEDEDQWWDPHPITVGPELDPVLESDPATEAQVGSEEPIDIDDGPFPLVGQKLPIPIRSQTKSNWCWAACTEMVMAHAEDAGTLGNPAPNQARIAREWFDRDCDGTTSANKGCNEGLTTLSQVAQVYTEVSGDLNLTQSAEPFTGDAPIWMSKSEIQKFRPVVVVREKEPGLGWAHMLVVYGWDEGGDNARLLLIDPAEGKEESWNPRFENHHQVNGQSAFRDDLGLTWYFWQTIPAL